MTDDSTILKQEGYVGINDIPNSTIEFILNLNSTSYIDQINTKFAGIDFGKASILCSGSIEINRLKYNINTDKNLQCSNLQ